MRSTEAIHRLPVSHSGSGGRVQRCRGKEQLLDRQAVEKLSSSAGKCCVGDEITLADRCLVPQVYNARKFYVDLRPYLTILRVDRHLEHHPAIIATHPNNQPDCSRRSSSKRGKPPSFSFNLSEDCKVVI
ncbi:probable maleylacetoacetate isomerase 2 [Pogonomyrmex barbatus]|uniref:Probable maleylacetoacetate isomerase 2 n=1 Tax=Pogonomyrmex barbatus TaxID=144034 RepID=A0A6I9XAP1_9HYME|nr:probable maleylacetoacetate isomerase 2 [Pogonomyrmex barbatus]